MSQSLKSEFGTLRSILWPIHRHELRKILPMLILAFCVCFNYSVLRNVKDTLVISAADSADVIPFIKLWMILPAAVGCTYIFTKLANRYTQEKVFYIILCSFLALFGIFAFILYPIRELLELSTLAACCEEVLPAGFHGAIMMCRHWPLAVFYVVAELWASMVLSVLFWGFANEVTKLHEVRRFYGVLSIAANFAVIVAGLCGAYVSIGWDYNPTIPFGSDAWEQTLGILILIVITSGMIAMTAFWWLNKYILIGKDYDSFHHNRKPMKSKKKLALGEAFKYLSKSRYLLCIAILVVGYNLSINLVEIVWKDQARQLYTSKADFNAYLYDITTWMGVIATTVAFVMPYIIDRFGWTKVAMITPALMLVTSLGFFGSIFFEGWFDGFFLTSLGVTPLAMAVLFGGAHNCLSKACKYSVFDMTKEMVFVPLTHEEKVNGKAAIDGVGSRLGKSGGAVVYNGLLMFFPTISACTPILGLIVLAMIVIWIVSVKVLGVEFRQVADARESTESMETEASNPESKVAATATI